jgi:hypothetical protein
MGSHQMRHVWRLRTGWISVSRTDRCIRDNQRHSTYQTASEVSTAKKNKQWNVTWEPKEDNYSDGIKNNWEPLEQVHWKQDDFLDE